MRKLAIALGTMAALGACSDARSRDIGRAEMPVESLAVAPPDTTSAARPARRAARDTAASTSPSEEARRAATPRAPRQTHRPHRPQPPAERRSVDTVATVDTVVRTDPIARTDTVVRPVPPDTTATAAPARDPIDTQPPPDTSARATPAVAPAPTGSAALPAGTSIHASLQDSISSRTDSAGRVVMAMVQSNVRNARGEVVVPAGSQVQMTVSSLSPAKSSDGKDGRLALKVDAITIDGRTHRVSGTVESVPHELRGRGITAGEAEKVGIGTAAGAVIGGVATGKTKGAVIGGVVGAAGGAVVAAKTASRDVVVKSGTPVVFVLTEPLTAQR